MVETAQSAPLFRREAVAAVVEMDLISREQVDLAVAVGG